MYNDYVMVYNSELIEEWAKGVKTEYDQLMNDWERSLEHYEFEMRHNDEVYWAKIRPLMEKRKEIGARR